MIKRETIYFEEGGEQYTEETLKASLKAARELDIKTVIVASNRGITGVKAAEMFKGTGIQVIVVGHQMGFPVPKVQQFKPENWEVKFEPEQVENLEGGDLQQVEVTITPAEQALVGDYSVAIQVQGEKASDDVEFRVTIKAAATWGWLGVALIVVVVFGLSITFKLLGRR